MAGNNDDRREGEAEGQQKPDLKDTTKMTREEINRLLKERQAEEPSQEDAEDGSAE